MFKKTKIAALSAAILGLSSMTAQAVSLTDTGSQGEVLIFPYYNVNNSFTTLFNIVNTTTGYKAVKLRFRESFKSNDVLDFNLYLSPQDVFDVVLTKNSKDQVVLTTTDNSCTQPKIPEGGVVFRDVYDSVDEDDLLEGYLEVIEMGVVDDFSEVYLKNRDEVITIAKGIKHVIGTDMPYDCAVIEAAWDQGVFIQGGARANPGEEVDPVSPGYDKNALANSNGESDAGWYGTDSSATGDWGTVMTKTVSGEKITYRLGALAKPAGGLVGGSILVDVDNVAAFVAEPRSVVGYSTIPQHYLSSDQQFYLLPSLASGSVADAIYLDTEALKAVTATWSSVARDWGLDDKNLLPNESVPSGINPLPMADALNVTYIGNQYFLSGGTATDWVLATPMRKHAIYNDYEYVFPGCSDTATCEAADYTAGVDIPVSRTDEREIGDRTAPDGFWKYLSKKNDVNAEFKYYDREEAEATVDPGDFSPPVQTPGVEVPFPREVNILALSSSDGSTASVLGSKDAQGLTLEDGFNDGWGFFDFSDYDLGDSRYATWAGTMPTMYSLGVPAHGFMSSRAPVNGGAVGETIPHAVKQEITTYSK